MNRDEILFEPESRQLQSARLEHLLNFSELLVLLIGESGLGRSQMVSAMRPESLAVKPTWTLLQLESSYDVTQLLKALVADLELDCASENRARLSAIHAYARALHEIGERLTICIDDADYLTDNALELLINFSRVDNSSPLILLTGLPEFEVRFFDRDFNKLVEGHLHIEHLMPFTTEESRSLIEAYLPENARVKDSVIKRVISNAQGRPGALKSEASKLTETSRQIPLKVKGNNRWYFGALALVSTILLATMLYLFIPSLSSKDSDAPAVARLNIPIPEPVQATNENTEEQIKVIEARTELSERLAAQEERLKDQAQQRQVQQEQTLQDKVEPPLELTEPEVITQEQVQVELPTPIEEPKPAVEVAEQVPPGSVADQAKEESPTVVAEAVQEEGPGGVKPKEVLVEKPSIAAVPAEILMPPQSNLAEQPSVTDSRPASVIEVMSWPKRDLTIQLMAAREKATAERFMRNYDSINGLLLMEYPSGGAPRFLVVYRHFASRQLAQTAVESLPNSLQRLNPWIRSVAGLQSELSSAYTP